MCILVSRIVCLVLLVSASTMTALHAQQGPPAPTVLTPVPRLMWFSGAFRPADNLPIALVESVTVTVYRDQNGGDALWQETQQVSMAADGRYSLLLGSTLPEGLPLELFTSGEPRWIGITVHRPGEVEQPRVHLASVAYALKAADADTLGGHPASAYRLAEPTLSPAASGTSGAPDHAPADTTTAATSGTASYLGMFVDSTNLGNSALFQSAGLVGVGTTAPRDGFHVAVNDGTGTFTGFAVQNLSGAASAYSGMLFYDQTGALGQFQGFNNASHEYRINNIASGGRINFLIGSSSKFLVANDGNIGVGVAVPGAKLDVAGSINASTQYNVGGSRVLSVGPGTGNIFVGVDAGRDSTSSSHQNAFFGVAAGRNTSSGISNAFFAHLAGLFNISGSANSFFGASAGLNNLSGTHNSFFGLEAGYYHLSGTSNAFFGSGTGHSNTTESFNTFIGSSSNGAATITNGTALGYRAQVTQSNSLVLGSINGSNGAIADTKVGIGTTAPGFKLEVVDASNTGIRVQTNAAGGTVASFGGLGQFLIDGSGIAGARLTILENGNVGIGATGPDHTLTVNGNANKVGGGSWENFSDERLKTIKGRFTPGLEAVMQLQPVRYEYKPDNALGLRSRGEHIGFSAQAVQTIVPEAVSVNDKGYLLVNNDPILWTMLNAIQEQQKEIQDLQRRLAALEATLAGRR